MQQLAAALSNLQSGLFTLIAFLFVLSIVVVVHELGHFLVARWCGVKVDAFAMGFGREIYGWHDSKGTRWRINWIPLGGYVKFMDDANGASMPSEEIIARMTPEERAVSFHAKALWKRAAVIFAGPLANFLLAIGLFASLYMIIGAPVFPATVEALVANSPAARAGLKAEDKIVAIDGTPVTEMGDLNKALARIVETKPGQPVAIRYERRGAPVTAELVPDVKTASNTVTGNTARYGEIGLTFLPRIGDVVPHGPADRAGFKEGDIIVDLDGSPIGNFVELQQYVSAHPSKAMEVTFRRAGALQRVNLITDSAEVTEPDGSKKTVGRLGIMNTPAIAEYRRYAPPKALVMGVQDSYFVIAQSLSAISRMVTRGENANQLGGPLQIADVAGRAAKKGFDRLLWIAALVSLSVGLFNLFPIPPLDGGHLLFYAAEAVLGKPLSDNAKELGFRMGFALILMLVMLVMWNDRIVLRGWMGG